MRLFRFRYDRPAGRQMHLANRRAVHIQAFCRHEPSWSDQVDRAAYAETILTELRIGSVLNWSLSWKILDVHRNLAAPFRFRVHRYFKESFHE
jgi:hypothetical protein